jgi:hypothetical protein
MVRGEGSESLAALTRRRPEPEEGSSSKLMYVIQGGSPIVGTTLADLGDREPAPSRVYWGSHDGDVLRPDCDIARLRIIFR